MTFRARLIAILLSMSMVVAAGPLIIQQPHLALAGNPGDPPPCDAAHEGDFWGNYFSGEVQQCQYDPASGYVWKHYSNSRTPPCGPDTLGHTWTSDYPALQVTFQCTFNLQTGLYEWVPKPPTLSPSPPPPIEIDHYHDGYEDACVVGLADPEAASLYTTLGGPAPGVDTHLSDGRRHICYANVDYTFAPVFQAAVQQINAQRTLVNANTPPVKVNVRRGRYTVRSDIPHIVSNDTTITYGVNVLEDYWSSYNLRVCLDGGSYACQSVYVPSGTSYYHATFTLSRAAGDYNPITIHPKRPVSGSCEYVEWVLTPA